MKQVKVFKTLSSLSQACASFLFNEMKKTLIKNGTVDVILAGGNTPVYCYRNLASILLKEHFPVDTIHWFFGDERWVPKAHEESNERMARKNLLDELDVPEERIYSWNPCHKDPHKCADDYDYIVRQHFINQNKSPDILLLGMGEDGHTASLFPESRILLEAGEYETVSPEIPTFATAVYVKNLNTWRLSLTPLFLNRARLVLFLISGKKKSESFKKVMDGSHDIPASWIQGTNVIYFVTEDAFKDGQGIENKSHRV
jgi:6-phosphogluconolactonase